MVLTNLLVAVGDTFCCFIITIVFWVDGWWDNNGVRVTPERVLTEDEVRQGWWQTTRFLYTNLYRTKPLVTI
jgi:hypothetical protein